ncbi:MAG: hypothetical protein AB1806_06530 [Acidobacteriota bacterium]
MAFRQAFDRLPASTKAAVWQKKIRRSLDAEPLTALERQVVLRGLALAVESKYKDSYEAATAQKAADRPFWTEVQLVLGLRKFVSVFVSIPKHEISEVTAVEPLTEEAIAELRLAFAKGAIACSGVSSWISGLAGGPGPLLLRREGDDCNCDSSSDCDIQAGEDCCQFRPSDPCPTCSKKTTGCGANGQVPCNFLCMEWIPE